MLTGVLQEAEHSKCSNGKNPLIYYHMKSGAHQPAPSTAFSSPEAGYGTLHLPPGWGIAARSHFSSEMALLIVWSCWHQSDPLKRGVQQT